MQHLNLFDFKITQSKKALGNLRGIAYEIAILTAYENSSKGLLLIVKDNFEVSLIINNLKAINPKLNLHSFLDYETLPYDALAPHLDIISNRLSFLANIAYEQKPLIVVSINALMQRLAPLSFIKKSNFSISCHDKRDIQQMAFDLVQQGYLQTDTVLERGEFAVRGEIVDIYPMASDEAYRIDFFDDEVESINVIDLQTQRSIKSVTSIKLFSAHEFPLDKEGIALFRSNYRNNFLSQNLNNHTIYQSISKGSIPGGIEYYLPLFFTETANLFDYLDQDIQVLAPFNIEKLAHNFDIEAHKRFSLFEGNPDHPPLAVYKVFLSADNLLNLIKQKSYALISKDEFNDSELNIRGFNNAKTCLIDDIAITHSGNKNDYSKFINYVQKAIDKKSRILISATSEGRRQALREIIPQCLVDQFGIKAASSFDDFLTKQDSLMLTVAPFTQGVNFIHKNLILITETELFGQQLIKQRQRSRKATIDPETLINNLAQLQIGQVVVHVDHGIGRYMGLKTLVINDIKTEFLQIQYQNNDILNIPITSLNKVARYSGVENPVLSKLGHDAWKKKKQKAINKIYDVAASLLDLYAKRKAHSGFAFNIDNKALDEFALGFEYEETADQKAAIDATLADMQKPIPMDRLICGDVGFGKTEVALRAAFVAAYAGKQVAILVPTTILVEQHYQNFKERFASFAIVVEALSRFASVKEQKQTIAKLKEGSVDIIIGTHKLLSKDVAFKDLGLIIIDEEHRFGVAQKEKLKQLRSQVDILTLTATPIPRTLNMSLEGMRELSIIATPPQNRLAIKTFVLEDSDQICFEAIMRELKRGGQVYYLHNDVSTIEQKQEHLQKLVPEAVIAIAHGQMHEKELQSVMKDFNHHRFNVLLCSTIVENGLDVASANTIIIDRADLLGLAQLHQIRGRVGRSHHQAYAYLFTPKKEFLSKDAKRRLEVLSSIDELGAGFMLATHDLEIRGAGEILGQEQSGQMEQIGFSLYMEMLNRTIKSLKSGKELSLNDINLNECEIDLHIAALFPDDYISNINKRLSLYKRLAALETNEQFAEFKVELIDIYGPLPQASINLIEISKLKKIATNLGIVRINANEKGGVIEFSTEHKVDNSYLLSIIQNSKHDEYKLIGANSLRYNLPESDKYSRLQLLDLLLRSFLSHSSLNKTKL